MNNLINEARNIPINEATPVFSISPISLSAPGREIDLQIRVSAPVTGGDLPVILLSHGHGPSLYIPSLDGYGPLTNFWAAHGFVVIQPSHLNSKVHGLPPSAPRGPLFWRSRVEDMKHIIDQLDHIEASVPLLRGRLDRSRIVIAGHSMGGHTAGMLLGARLTDPKDKDAIDVNMLEPRIKAGVLLAAPGNGGDDLSTNAAENYSFLNPDFSHMSTPTLVVAGDEDVSPHLTIRGADWYADPYHLSPGSKCLLTLYGAKHGLGGIAGYDAKETGDEDPDRLAAVQRFTWAYLRSQLYPEDFVWDTARAALKEMPNPLGQIECKS